MEAVIDVLIALGVIFLIIIFAACNAALLNHIGPDTDWYGSDDGDFL